VGRAREREADPDAEAGETRERAPKAAPPVATLIELQRSVGNREVSRLLQRQPTQEVPASEAPAKKPSVSWEEAWTVVHAISDIMNEYHVVEGGLAYPRWHPSHHPEVPAKYRELLDHWFQVVTRQPIKTAGGAELSLSGTMRATHLHQLSQQTDPLIEILLKEGDENTMPWLEKEYWRPLAALHRRAFEEEIHEDIERRAGVSNLATLSEEEALKEATSRALENVRLATTLVTRFTNSAAVDAAKQLDELFKAAAAKGATGPVGIETIKGMRLPAALMHLKSGLDGVNAILTVADPQAREHLLRSRPDLFGKVSFGVDVLQILGQFVSGATALTTASAWAYASITGNAQLAGAVLARAAPVLDKLNVALNVIGVVHGVLVLLDDEATDEQKAAAAVEVGISGAGVAGFLLRFAGVSGVSGPLTLSVAATYYTFNALAKLAIGASAGILKLWLGAAYETMQRRGKEVHAYAMRFAAARDLADAETADYRRDEYMRNAEVYHSILKGEVTQFLDILTKPASDYIGAAHRPGSFDSIRRRFEPLAGRPMETQEQTLDVAAELIRTLVDCFTHADKVFQEEFDAGWEEHAAVKDAPPGGEGAPDEVA
jgi:hypothetical protein